jgi:hypothetical protein
MEMAIREAHPRQRSERSAPLQQVVDGPGWHAIVPQGHETRLRSRAYGQT